MSEPEDEEISGPRSRVSNSQIEYELRLVQLELKQHISKTLRSALEPIEDKLIDVNATVSEHLTYHNALVIAAKELADKRNKRLTLVLSFAMLVVAAISLFLGATH